MNYAKNPQMLEAFALKPMLIILATSFASHALAQEPNTAIDLPSVAVTGNPLGVGSDELVVPVSILSGRELSLKRESTLGDTLNGIPGVAATHFGPNASRPVIRGLDAERVRIMQNGIGILDASSLSFDHAVGVDPIVIEQIDVVRGPAALLYGGSAVGGVVNVIDHRIPKEKLEGITGRGEVRFGGAESQRNGAAVVDVGNGQFAIHGDAYSRKTSDLDIPGFSVSKRKNQADGTLRENRGMLVNSSAESDGGALGASLTFDNGYVGTSYSTLNNNYGTVAEEAVRIDMKSDRWDFASEFSDLGNIINRAKLRLAHTDYQHQELENGEVGTTFKNRGIEGSVEVGHAKIGNITGVVGFQFNNTNFEALGDEAFVPGVNTQNKAIYVYEELPINQHKITFGGRIGHTSVDSKTDAKFGAGQSNNFNPNSYALGGLYRFNPNWSLASNLSHNERAPSYFELYANGAHLATGQFEVGNSNFDKERSNGLDAQIRWKDGKNSFNFGAYYTRFSNFIGLLDTGNIDADSGLPVAQFSAFAATFKGFEAEGRFNVDDNLDLTLRGDYVRATNHDNRDALPRITPLRLGAGLHYQKNNWGARIDVLRAFNQSRTAPNELTTDGYTDVSALVTYKLPTKVNLELFAKANNLLNQEIREHASFLKDLSPAGERSALLGLRADF
ncbi:MAG: TonB-dependent receptor [Methylotenera sp. RIFCSPLOWO2_02_FULL_45_14]|nr:MAG: TonB-dependent receptor [Methylotenera sp. RIFCSPLOWO2_02_FULL_45_14]